MLPTSLPELPKPSRTSRESQKSYFSNPIFHINIRVLKQRFLAFSQGPGGFRELREAGRKLFHLSWYLLVPGITSYDQKPWGEKFVFYKISGSIKQVFSFFPGSWRV